jgi:hypothetical protein
MTTPVIPDLGGATPSTCTRVLAHATTPVHAVDEALSSLCVAAPALPSLLTHHPLGPTLSDHRPGLPGHVVHERPDVAPPPGDHRALPSIPQQERPTEPKAGLCPPEPSPRPRVRRTETGRPPEPPAARAVREDPACRVGTAQLRVLAGELPARSGVRGSRSLPPPRSGDAPAAALPVESWSGRVAELTRRLSIDVRPSLACPPRPGPSAPPDLLDRSAVARARVADGSALARVDPVHARWPAADASPRVTDPRRPAGGPEGPAERRHAGTQAPDDQPGPGSGRAAAGRRPRAAEARAAERGRVAADSYEEWAGPGSRSAPDRRAGPFGPDDGRHAGPEGPDERGHEAARGSGERRWAGTQAPGEGGYAGMERTDARWGAVQADDGVVEAAVERVLTDAARRHGIGV